MTAYRLAVLIGNSPRLSACSVYSYLTLTATNYREALKQAARLNTVIVVHYPAKRGAA